MDDDSKTSSERLESLNRRLSGTRKAFEQRSSDRGSGGSAYSFGFRLAADLVAGVLGGFGLGWLLDWLLGTSPWMLLILTPLGMAAGVLNVIRAAKSAEARRHLEQTKADGIPSVPDDDD
ncbi:MAG: AtpZ/AtpI family protein [Parvibaculaceae bacterium]